MPCFHCLDLSLGTHLYPLSQHLYSIGPALYSFIDNGIRSSMYLHLLRAASCCLRHCICILSYLSWWYYCDLCTLLSRFDESMVNMQMNEVNSGPNPGEGRTAVVLQKGRRLWGGGLQENGHVMMPFL